MFTLDSRLQQDTLLLGDLPLCRVLLMNDASYPWCILVPRRAGVSELFELSAAEQQQLWQESSRLAALLKQAFAADKMNVASLGNVVSQLHMHVLARHRDDPAWPAPVWGRAPAQPYTKEALAALRARLLPLLQGEAGFTEAGDE